MTQAAFIDGNWIKMTPRQFRDMQPNRSIPDAALEDEGLVPLLSDPKPAELDLIVEPGPIEDRRGKPYLTWVTRAPRAWEIEEQKARLLSIARRAYSRAMSQIKQKYPDEVREGWGEQIKAAEAVQANGGPHPLIENLRARTGETEAEMVAGILVKRDAHLELYGQMTGALRGLEKQIEAAASLSELNAIDIDAAFGF